MNKQTAVILGPVGLLVGAASVGIGMGIMQIPEEQRTNVRNHAATSLEKARDIACEISDSMSTNCAKYGGADSVPEVVGRVVPEEFMDSCGCYPAGGSRGEEEDNNFRGDRHQNRYHHRGGGPGGNGMMGMGGDDGHSLTGAGDLGGLETRSEGSSPIANAVNGVERGMNRLVGDVFGDDQQHSSPVSQSMNMVGVGGGSALGGDKGRGVGAGGPGDHHHHGGMGAAENEDAGGRRVACGRKGEFWHTIIAGVGNAPAQSRASPNRAQLVGISLNTHFHLPLSIS